MRGGSWPPVAALVLCGAGWGATQPLSKVAVSGGYQQFGLIFWQMVIGAVILVPVVLARGRGLRCDRRALGIYALIAMIGTVVPNSALYRAIVDLPAGVVAVLISVVPMLAFPVALALGLEGFRARRLAGLCAGLAGVMLITLPEASLPDPAAAALIPLALIAPLCYAFEGNIVARWGTAGLDPVEVLAGASVVGAVIALPLAFLSGHWIAPRLPWDWGAPDWALVAESVIHAFVYSCYLWLVGRAGPIFAAQVSYLTTGFGVLWSMGLLGERYTGWLWAALALMFCGLFLVQPRRETLAVGEGAGEDARQRRIEESRG